MVIDAAAVINLKKQDLHKVSLGINIISKGFVWSYSYTFPKHINDNRRKVVHQLTMEEEFVSGYESVSEASKQTGCNKASITKLFREERKSCGGLIWIFK